VRVIENGRALDDVFLDVAEKIVIGYEEGLLDIALAPGFPSPNHFYITYTTEDKLVLSRFEVNEQGTSAVKESEQRLLATHRWANSHHGGQMEFGPHDGFLYLAVGDSDHGGNPTNSAQDLSLLQGKILRLDVEAATAPYAVPDTNPFVGSPSARPEIWLFGLRNPWRFSFDTETEKLIIGDVGRNHWEEINVAGLTEAGINFGWPMTEGNECVSVEVEKCEDPSIRWPVYEYPHNWPSIECSITGGAIYRGARFPEWVGAYVFGDLCGGIWAIRDLGSDQARIREIVSDPLMATAIAAGRDGEILLTAAAEGALYRLMFPPDATEGWRPLSEVHSDGVTWARRTANVGVLNLRESRWWMLIKQISDWYNYLGRPPVWWFVLPPAIGCLILLAGALFLGRAYARRRLTN
jgi:glucose/arabinose dehydrogenase